MCSRSSNRSSAPSGSASGPMGPWDRATPSSTPSTRRRCPTVSRRPGGGAYISSGVAERLALELGSNYDATPHMLLSDREYQIFRMIVSGTPIGGIANELSLSIKTVSTHKTRILQKMRMTSSAELIHYAIRHQLVELPSES